VGHMGFIKYLLKLVLLSAIILAAVSLYFYNKHSEKASFDQAGTVNDVTGLNPIAVADIVQPESEQDIVDAITRTSGPISIGGARYSMGGQTAYPDSLHFDMRGYNQVVSFDADKRLITVQSGMTWRQLQEYIDPHDLSVMVMQDFNNFSVGGSLSVNAFGRYLKTGAVINSVVSIRIVLANGLVYQASRQINPALFYGAIGGYGGLGVITHVTLRLEQNEAIERSVKMLDFHRFLQHFRDNVLNDRDVVMHNAVLYPPSYETLLDISWRRSEQPLTEPRRLHDDSDVAIWKNVLTDMLSSSNLLKRLRKNLVDPIIYNQPAVVRRNWEASFDLHNFGFLSTKTETLAMRTYFVPVEEFEIFTLKMRDTFIRTDANILNITVRYVPADKNSMMSWAREDMFSFTITYYQARDEDALAQNRLWSSQLIQAAIDSRGSYYMPFQIHESTEQFARAYPNAGDFFRLKDQADPDNRFRNMLLLEHYARNQSAREAYYAALQEAQAQSSQQAAEEAEATEGVEAAPPAQVAEDVVNAPTAIESTVDPDPVAAAAGTLSATSQAEEGAALEQSLKFVEPDVDSQQTNETNNKQPPEQAE